MSETTTPYPETHQTVNQEGDITRTYSQQTGNGEYTHITVDEHGNETEIRFPDESEA